MIRTLLTTTAVALLLSAPAMAQNSAPAADPNAAAPAASSTMAPAGDMNLLTKGYMAAENDHLASRLMGQPVYTSAAKDAEQIGDINDLVLNEGGQIGAVVIGVGGFLGIGEKNVAVDYSNLQWVTAEDNTQRLVLPTDKDALTAAAEFTWPDETATPAMDTAANNTMAPAPATDTTKPAADTAATTTPAPAMDTTKPATDTAATTTPAPAMDTTKPATDTAATTTPAPAMDTTKPADQTAVAQNNNMAQGMQSAQDTSANPNAAPLDYNSMAAVDSAKLTTADELIGTKVVGPNNEEIAEVGDIVLTPDGKVDSLLVDFGGFLGIGQKRVAVGMENLRFVTDANGTQYVFINATKEQLDQAPAYDEASYATNRDAQRLVVTN